MWLLLNNEMIFGKNVIFVDKKGRTGVIRDKILHDDNMWLQTVCVLLQQACSLEMCPEDMK